jgi:hypothetical protein
VRQGKRQVAHLERVLFVCGSQNAGKSRLLRNMFHDPRFRSGRPIHYKGPVAQIALSQARRLFIKLSSPHERGETISDLFSLLDGELRKAWRYGWRMNFACAVQPDDTGITPDIVKICEQLDARFLPERIRIAQINPRQDNSDASQDLLNRGQINRLWRINAEIMSIDGRRAGQPTNGMMLADYFDFT